MRSLAYANRETSFRDSGPEDDSEKEPEKNYGSDEGADATIMNRGHQSLHRGPL